MKHKLMEVMRLREDGRQLDGRVEIDDAYLGGERTAARPGAARRTRCRSSPRCRPPRTASRSWRACRQRPFTKEAMATFFAAALCCR